MRIAKIEINDFRAFPGPTPYCFDLQGGKNLLVFGENGSGKSSLFRALVEFFNRGPKADNFGWHRNIFSSGPDKSSLDGYISVNFDDGMSIGWKCLGNRPHQDASLSREKQSFLVDATRRKAFLNYRSLLRTNFGDTANSERLFELTVSVILANVPVTLPGGTETTIGALWQNVLSRKPTRHTNLQLRTVERAVNEFNTGLRSVLPDVERKAAEILAQFTGGGISLKLDLPGVRYNGAKLSRERAFVDRILEARIEFCGHLIPEWSDFLNEARLSALAMALYLAGTLLGNPDPPPGSPPPFRLMVLDDVLIGLDLSHRLPLLEVIEKYFSEFQVFLFTYDRVWFELAQLKFAESEKWITCEMFSRPMEVGGQVFEAPTLRPRDSGKLQEYYLLLAQNALDNGFEKPAAFYTRAAFEVILKRYCDKYKVQVAYDLDGRHLNSDHFLDAIERRLIWNGSLPKTLFTIQRVKMFRQGVLNPLSHFHPVTVSRVEVQLAITTIKSLQFHEAKTDFAKETERILRTPCATAEQVCDAACWLSATFETGVREFLLVQKGHVVFRYDWVKMSLSELWESATKRMNEINPTVAASLISVIEKHRRVFLAEWKFSEVSALTKHDLDIAWADLRDASVTGSYKTRLATFA
jgi:hypothetical protein